MIGCDKDEGSLARLRAGDSPVVEHSKNLFPASTVLDHTCPNCGIKLLRVGDETFCPGCMRRADVSSGAVRLSTRLHDVPMRAEASHEMDDLLASALASGRLRLTSDTAAAVRESGFVVFTVGTPIDANKRPDNSGLVSASKDVGRGLIKGTVVIVRSTVSPGTTDGLVGRILEEESGLTRGRDFGLAHVPETTIEGLALFELRTLPKMIGGVDSRSSKAAAALFGVFKCPVRFFEGTTTTEAAKLFLNIYRDTNIALANELALACEALGIDTMKVIEATRTDPKTNFLIPGPGVGGFCLPPWSMVQTATGLRPIAGIVPGDSVLSHDGRYHVVTRVMTRNYSGPIVRLAGRGFNSYPIECTPEHRVLVKKRVSTRGKLFYSTKGRKKMTNMRATSERSFTVADQIEQGDILCLPMLLPRRITVPSVPYSQRYRRGEIMQQISCTPDMMYLFGLYVAEGTVWDDQITFSLHRKEEFIVSELDSIGRAEFRHGVAIHRRTGNGMTARMSSKPLANYLKDTFGHEAWNKAVPITWATALPEDHLKSLLRGIWLGDGSNSQGRFAFGTTSRELWNFMQLSFLRLGIRFAVNESPEHRGRDGTWHKRSYYLRSCHIEKMNALLHPAQHLKRVRQEYRTMWYDNGYLEFAVRSKSIASFDGEVWNLEVEGSNTYVVQGGVVHNCLPKDLFYLTQPASQKGFVPNLLTVARQVNDSMPSHVEELTAAALREARLPVKGTRVAILGAAFKGNTGDTRESPSFTVIDRLRGKGADIIVHDPLVSKDDRRLKRLKVARAKSLREAVRTSTAVLVLTDHLEYRGLSGRGLKKLNPGLRVIVDARHILDPDEVRTAGLVYRGVGHGEGIASKK